MKNSKKQSHSLRFFTCVLVTTALTLPAALPEPCSAKAYVAVHTEAQTATFVPSVSGPQTVPPGKSTSAKPRKGKKMRIRNGIINKVEISLEDAVALAQEEADRYYDDLHLTNVYSYDNDQLRKKSSGTNGAREWWYVNFANEKENFVSILIADGEILNTEHFDRNANHGLFDLSDVKLTAKRAVKKARASGLRGGNPNKPEEWVSGFNFSLTYSSLAESPDDIRLFFEVIGISPNGNFAHVDFDAMTGELLLAEEKIEYENGDVEWRKF